MSAQPSHDKDGLKSATGLILTALFALVWLGMLLRACCSQAQIFSNGTPPTGQDEARAWWSAAVEAETWIGIGALGQTTESYMDIGICEGVVDASCALWPSCGVFPLQHPFEPRMPELYEAMPNNASCFASLSRAYLALEADPAQDPLLMAYYAGYFNGFYLVLSGWRGARLTREQTISKGPSR